jgi:hypothetical protein
MLSFLRRNQYGIMLLVAIFVVIAFVFWDPSYQAAARSGEFGKGKKIKVGERVFRPDEIDNIKKSFQALYGLGDNSVYTHAMAISSMSQKVVQQDAKDDGTPPDAIINTAIVREESRRLGIDVDDKEVEAKIRTFSRFQTPEGQFDGEEWKKFLDAQGGSGGQRRQLMFDGIKDMIRLEKLSALVGIEFPMSNAEVDWTYNQRYQKTTVALVEVPKAKFAEQTVSDDDIKKYYDENKDKPELQSAEQRAVQVVLIANPKEDEIKDLPEDQKEAKRKATRLAAKLLADQLIPEERGTRSLTEIAAAISTSQNLTPALEVKTFPAFEQKAPPVDLAGETELITDIFKRSADEKTNVINSPAKGYYAYEVSEIKAPQPQSLEAVKALITGKLKEQKQTQQLTDEVNKVKDQLKAALAEKKTISDAATAAGYSARELGAFSQQKPLTAEPQFNKIATLSANLNAGELSEAFDTGTGSVFIYVVKKELPNDPAMADQKKTIRDSAANPGFRMANSNPVFSAWFDKEKEKVIRDLSTTK